MMLWVSYGLAPCPFKLGLSNKAEYGPCAGRLSWQSPAPNGFPFNLKGLATGYAPECEGRGAGGAVDGDSGNAWNAADAGVAGCTWDAGDAGDN